MAFRVTPTVAEQLKELAAEEQRTLSTWMNLRAQEVIKAYENVTKKDQSKSAYYDQAQRYACNSHCAQVGQINFVGNIIPHTWYGQLTLPNGKPYLNAIIILSDIVYWYRPSEDMDEATGKLRGYKRKFWGDLLQRTYDLFADQFGLSKGQCQDAIKFLEDQGLITRVFCTVKTEKGFLTTSLH